ncbi:MAG: hypothetical protein KIT84_38020 [Labilithrix sp.]|nr:hypothetical protein [Labilithrix sp.]MCW5816856.1 hypothetical protein [Labilithrix sp.]
MRFEWKQWMLAWLLAPSLACDGCRRAPSPSVVDAGGDASHDATAAILPWTGRVVARSVGVDMGLVQMLDDGLVVTSGPAVFAVGPDGALQRIGTPADAVPLLLEGDDEMGGFDARPITLGRETVSGPATRPFVRPAGAAAFEWTGKAWTKAGIAPPPLEHPRHGEPFAATVTAGLPEGYEWTERHVTQKEVVWLGRKRRADTDTNTRTIDEGAIGPAPGRPARIVRIAPEHEDTTYRSCHFIESADERTYISCVSSDQEGDYQHPSYVLDGDRWTPHAVQGRESVRAIDAEGAVWYVEGGNPPPTWLVRITRDGKDERFDPPAAPPELTAPGYRSDAIAIGFNAGSDLKNWIATTILDPVPPVPIGWIYRIVPRRSGDVWIIGRDSGSVEKGTTIVRYTRGGGSGGAAPTLVRSSADERNAVHHARGVRTWAGHCVSLFVPFPRRGRDAAAEPAAFYAEHKAEIDEAVALSDRKGGKVAAPLEVAIVDGRLDGHRVGGVLFIRSDPAADEERMESAARKLAEIATPDPASPATVTCSMPELDRVIERLRVAKPERY